METIEVGTQLMKSASANHQITTTKDALNGQENTHCGLSSSLDARSEWCSLPKHMQQLSMILTVFRHSNPLHTSFGPHRTVSS